MRKMKLKISDEVLLLNYKIHMESPYNDGWTQEVYRKEYNKLLKKMKKKEKKLADNN
jgi:cell division protein FtsL